MNIVVFDLETNGTGISPNTESIIAISAVKMNAEYPTAVETFDTLVLGQPPVPSWVNLNQLREAPSIAEALLDFSRFVGESLLISDNGPSQQMPFIYESCTRRGIPMRELRLADLRDMARKLWGGSRIGGLSSIEENIRLSEPPVHLSRLASRTHKLAEAVHLMWRELSSDFTRCPVSTNTGYLPDPAKAASLSKA
jgi:DNA polymerase III alpha subunit (gram-positive type)